MKKKYSIYPLVLLVSLIACEPDENSPDMAFYDDPVEYYVGSWLCEETSAINGTTTFSVDIVKSASNSAEVGLVNFYLFGSEDTARAIVADDRINIPYQSFCNHIIQGDGFLNGKGDQISWSYSVNDGVLTDECTALFKRK